MSGKSINFANENTEKKKMEFYKNKNIFKIDEIDVDKILVSKKESYGTNKSFNNFIGIQNSDNDNIKPLSINFPQMIGYVKHFKSNKTMSFNVTDNKPLKKYTKILKKLSVLSGKNLIVKLFMVIVINT